MSTRSCTLGGMEVLALLALAGFVLWLAARSTGGRRLTAEAERRQALSEFAIDNGDGTFGDLWRFNFTAMRAGHELSLIDDGKRQRSVILYSLRRREGPLWDLKFEEKSWREMLEESKTWKPNLLENQQAIDDKRNKLAKEPQWESLREEMSAPVETAYQRYVRQG